MTGRLSTLIYVLDKKIFLQIYEDSVRIRAGSSPGDHKPKALASLQLVYETIGTDMDFTSYPKGSKPRGPSEPSGRPSSMLAPVLEEDLVTRRMKVAADAIKHLTKMGKQHGVEVKVKVVTKSARRGGRVPGLKVDDRSRTIGSVSKDGSKRKVTILLVDRRENGKFELSALFHEVEIAEEMIQFFDRVMDDQIMQRELHTKLADRIGALGATWEQEIRLIREIMNSGEYTPEILNVLRSNNIPRDQRHSCSPNNLRELRKPRRSRERTAGSGTLASVLWTTYCRSTHHEDHPKNRRELSEAAARR